MLSLVLMSSLPVTAAPPPSLHRHWQLRTPVLHPSFFSTNSSANAIAWTEVISGWLGLSKIWSLTVVFVLIVMTWWWCWLSWYCWIQWGFHDCGASLIGNRVIHWFQFEVTGSFLETNLITAAMGKRIVLRCMGKAWKPQSQNRCEKQTEATTFPFWQLRSAIERKCPPNCILKESAKMRGLSIHEYTQSTTAALVACSCSPYVSWMSQQGNWLFLTEICASNQLTCFSSQLAYMPRFTWCNLDKLSSFYINQSRIKD